MENSKAIEIFNKWMDCKDAYQADPSCDGNCPSCEYYTSAEGDKEAMLLAIAALGKQIPKKPVWKEIDITNDGVPCKNAFCPVCEAEYEPDDIDRIGFDYCYSCGQALNWGDDHDRVL